MKINKIFLHFDHEKIIELDPILNKVSIVYDELEKVNFVIEDELVTKCYKIRLGRLKFTLPNCTIDVPNLTMITLVSDTKLQLFLDDTKLSHFYVGKEHSIFKKEKVAG